MKFVSFIVCAVLGMVGSAQPVSDAAQICTKACQAAPVEQRETCLRVCTQFAEQSAGFVAPSSTAAAATAATSAPAKSLKPTGSSAPAATSSANSGKSRGEDNDEDHESSMESSSMSHPVSGASRAYINAVAVLAVISTSFI
ncbi:hypothetical protein EV183_005415 [Coemansia sp. RSA 2336]|nr:hypothetical protein EV183_005415 [Coemansia sp. RSA 2336]